MIEVIIGTNLHITFILFVLAMASLLAFGGFSEYDPIAALEKDKEEYEREKREELERARANKSES